MLIIEHTRLNSSRVGGTRRGRGGGRSERSSLVAAALVAVAVAVMVMGAVASGSVMVVSWDVLMVELSKTELASGERDRLAEAGGDSCTQKESRVVSMSLKVEP